MTYVNYKDELHKLHFFSYFLVVFSLPILQSINNKFVLNLFFELYVLYFSKHLITFLF